MTQPAGGGANTVQRRNTAPPGQAGQPGQTQIPFLHGKQLGLLVLTVVDTGPHQLLIVVRFRILEVVLGCLAAPIQLLVWLDCCRSLKVVGYWRVAPVVSCRIV